MGEHIMPRNKECPVCRDMGRDKNKDHLWLMSDGKTWACFKPYHSPYFERHGNTISKQDANDDGFDLETMEMVQSYPTFDQEYRGIRGEIYKHFNIRYCVDEQQGNPEFLFYPIKNTDNVIVGYQRRSLFEKDFRTIGDVKGEELQLFAIEKCDGGKNVVICEGHQDALASYQMLKDKYPQWNPNITSTNRGTTDLQSINNTLDQLRKYQNVLLCFDNDAEGEKFIGKTVNLIGQQAKVMGLPLKDANDMLLEGKESSFITAFFNAKDYLPTDIVTPESLEEEVLKPIQIEVTFPFNGINEYTFGIFRKQIITIGAGVGTGKSVFIDSIIRHLIMYHNEKVGLFSLEEHPSYTMKKLIGGTLGVPLHLPGDYEHLNGKIKGVLHNFTDNLYLYNSQGYRDTKDVENTLRYLASIGVHYCVIDPLTALVAELSASEGNERLNAFCAKLASLVMSLDMAVFLVSHLNTPKNGRAHSEGGRVSGEQATGSRAAYRWSHVFLGLERNLQAEEEEEKNKLLVRIIKNRLVGRTGTVGLQWNADKYRLEDDENVFM